MAISKEEVIYVARLARLEFTDEEIEEFTHQLGKVLDYIEKLKELDVEGVEPTYHPLKDLVSVMRKDEVKRSLTQEEALANAPDAAKGHFRVPKIIETS
ncbi:MAG: Asp-tRNA(Asn)/Glu-tRNA(Gln) amidotransferase subunit GatC [Deferribacteres bacterium]|nr:Asp-tRNA(Asn)/Glu-tRNA(Gln) amidotransferase subunit GatC [Deferribacteres bacterium]